jgi:hypothetical protein
MSAVLNTTSVRNKTHRPAPVAERYGMLKVLLFVPKKGWLCKCDCGVEKYIEGNPLRTFRHLSCGCNAKARRVRTPTNTLQMSKKQAKKALPRRTRHPAHGTRCWVCRNKTGTDEAVALCKVCLRGCV